MNKSPLVTAIALSAVAVSAAIMFIFGRYAFKADTLYFVITAFVAVPYVSAAASFFTFAFRSSFFAIVPLFASAAFSFLPLVVFSDFYAAYSLSALSGCVIGSAAGAAVRKIAGIGRSAFGGKDLQTGKENAGRLNSGSSAKREKRKFTGAR